MLNPAGPDFLARLENQLGVDIFRPLSSHYLEEPRKRIIGQGAAVVAPRTVDEVSQVLVLCNDARVGVIPFGGGTGLVGGQLQPDDIGATPLILSLERMNALRGILAEENTMIAEAGMTLAAVQEAAEAENRLFPLSLASEGTCQIGGNLATNAGGVNVLRYGNTRDLCLGLEAVLADGTVLNSLSRLRKDNTGYDLKNLLIGSEGTLGIITAASLRLMPRPAQMGTAMFVVRDPDAALTLLALARDICGDTVSAFELIHKTGLEFLAQTLPEISQPFANPPEWSVLIELGVPAALDPQALLTDLFEAAVSGGLSDDGVVAQSLTQRYDLWSVREHIPAANKRIGAIVSHDISLPLTALSAFIPESTAKIAALGSLRINCFGHLGDGNLHYNVFPPQGQSHRKFAHLKDRIERLVHDLVAGYGGSFSAEHGVGRLKAGELKKYAPPEKLRLMHDLKSTLDPNGILNPGAVFA